MTTTDSSQVVGPEVLLRRRWDRLRTRRCELAEMAVEYFAHGLPEAMHLYQRSLDLEECMAVEFPDQFEIEARFFVEEEALLFSNHRLFLSPACQLCRDEGMSRSRRDVPYDDAA